MKRQLIICGLLVIVAGCNAPNDGADNGGDANGTRPVLISRARATSRAKAQPWDPSLGTVTIEGAVKFLGEPRPPEPIDMTSRAECNKLHANPVLDETVLVSPDGALKNVFVWVKRGLKAWDFLAPSEPIVLDQSGCIFHPHVLGMQVGQPFIIRNSDTFLHNVHSFARSNYSFNFGQPPGTQEDTREFRRREVMIEIRCDVHGWMKSYIGVVPHPYFAVTGDDGLFELNNLPPGDLVIEAWHEEFGTNTVDVTVADNETTTINFSFEGP